MYAIIKLAGTQYKLEKGTEFYCNKIETKKSKILNIKEVLFVKKGNSSEIGRPYVKGCKVECEVLGNSRARKKIAFKYIKRKDYRRKVGHRQYLTRLRVKDIITG